MYDYYDLRVSDRERSRALAILNREHRRGRIDSAELAERSDAVSTARTWGDLEPVLADLPSAQSAVRGTRRGFGRPFGRPFPVPFPLLPLLVIAIIIAATGHVPWIPIVVIAVLLLAFAPWRRRHWRRAGWAC